MYDSKYLIFNNQYCVVIMMWIRHVDFNTNLCVFFRFSQIINSSKILLRQL